MCYTTDIYRTVIMVGLLLLSLETSGELKTSCPTYVREGIDLNCECFVSNTSSSANINWNITGGGPHLNVTNARRENNGTKYTCTGDWGSPPSRQSLTYTLHVVFGPESVKMSTNMTNRFVTDGTVQVALFCQAVAVYPAANYIWTGVTCVNEDHSNGTCIFTPRVPEDHRREVSCTAHNVIFPRLYKSVQDKLWLTYPPTSPPAITREDTILTCTVKGGEPMVSSVTFSCGNESDRPDVVDDVSVSSSVVISVHQQHSHVMCECSAKWDPQPGFYRHKAITPLNLIEPGSQSSYKDKTQLLIPVAVGAASAVVLLVIIVIIICVTIKKRQQPTVHQPTSNYRRRQHDEIEEQVNEVYVSADILGLG